MGLFTAMEEEAISTTNTVLVPENEITVYASIGNKDGLEQNDGVEKHKDYIAKFAKEGCKARVRVATKGGVTTNYLTLKIKSKEELHSAIASSQEYTIEVDDAFVEAFALIAEEPLVKTRYVFNSKTIEIKYKLGDDIKTVVVPKVLYEIDVFKGQPDMCKIDIEIDNILNAINASEFKDTPVNIVAKVSHLPFKPTNVFSEDTDPDKVVEFWDKVKN